MESIKSQISGDDPGARFVYAGEQNTAAVAQNPRRIPHPAPSPAAPATRASAGPSDGGSLPAGEAKILAALIQYPNGLTKEQLTLFSGFKRSTRDLYLQRLGRAGFVTKEGDRNIATAAGRKALPNAPTLPRGKALREYWLAKLPEGERKIFAVLVQGRGEWVSREFVSEHSGYLRSTRDLYLQRLARRQLIELERSKVRAGQELFA